MFFWPYPDPYSLCNINEYEGGIAGTHTGFIRLKKNSDFGYFYIFLIIS